jgi:predicted dehydrogenase
MGGLIRGVDKGHRRQIQAFVDAIVAGAAEPVPFADAVNVTRATFATLESIRVRHPVKI